jgi:hypothetical protein
MNFSIKQILALSILFIFLIGCSGVPIRFGGDTPNYDRKNVDFSKGREISGQASGFQLFMFIPINVNHRHEQAYQQLLEAAGSDYITDVKIEESWTYAYVGTVYSTMIKATAYPHKAN